MQEGPIKITIGVSTYNRAYTLGWMYDSLKAQKNKAFEWVIVDDGSTDNTRELVAGWIKEGLMKIRYFYQENQGMNSGFNKAVELADPNTELFVARGSDDCLTDSAIDDILSFWEANKKDGLIGILAYNETEKKDGGYDLVTRYADVDHDEDTLKGFYNHGMKGDTVLIFRTSIIKQHKFPHFEGEKFVPDNYLWDILDQYGTYKLMPKPVSIGGHLPDGLTTHIASLLYNNPQGYFAYINQRLKLDKTPKERFLDSIRYVAMAIAHEKKRIISGAVRPGYAFLAYLPGMLFYNLRYKKVKEEEKAKQ